MRLYQSRPQVVEAFELSDDFESRESVRRLGGEMTPTGLAKFHDGPNLKYARPGEMVVRTYGGVTVMHRNEFAARFEPILHL